MKEAKMTKKDIKKAQKEGMGKEYILNFLGNFVMVLMLGFFVAATGAASFVEGVVTGFWLWLGFVVTTSLSPVLWEKRSMTIYLINALYNAVVIGLAGGVLAIWG